MPNSQKGLIVPLPAVVFVTVDQDSCKPLAKEFVAKGYEINYVKDGIRALNLSSLKANNWKPSLFIIDLVIPGDSGFVVTKLVHDKYSEAKMPVILMTSQIAPEDVMEAAQIGALGLLEKPLKFHDVNAVLEKERLRRMRMEASEAALKNRNS